MFRYGFKKHLLEMGVDYGSTVLAAVSGGMDSMCMADALLNSGLDLTVAVAHVNFNLRGEESDADTEMVCNWCSQNGITLHRESFDTTGYASKMGISIEMAARELRYEWFYKLMAEHKYDFLAIAHNANDNAETLLLNLTRGCGIDGIGGIREIVPLEFEEEVLEPEESLLVHPQAIIRPLLCYSRKQIEKYALKFNVPYRTDSTNLLSDYSRNRIRNEVFPQLEKINPSVIATFNRNIRHFRQAGSIMQKHIEEKLQLLCNEYTTFEEFCRSKFAGNMCGLNILMNRIQIENRKETESIGFQKRMKALERGVNSGNLERGVDSRILECGVNSGNLERGVDSGNLERGVNSGNLERGEETEHPEYVTPREYSALVCIVELEKLLQEEEWEFWVYQIASEYGFSPAIIENICGSVLEEEGPKKFLSGNGEIIAVKERGLLKFYLNVVPDSSFNIDTVVIPREAWRTRKEQCHLCPTLYMDASKIEMPLSCRTVEAGDRFSPLGLRGSKKVTDYLSDIKFENLHKGNVLVMTDASGKIVCLPGLQISNQVRVTESTQEVLQITVC